MTLSRLSAGISLVAVAVMMSFATETSAQAQNPLTALRILKTYSYTGTGKGGGAKGIKLSNDFSGGPDFFLKASSDHYRSQKNFAPDQPTSLIALKAYLQELTKTGQVLNYEKAGAPAWLDASKPVTVSAWTVVVMDHQNGEVVCEFPSKNSALAIEACMAQVKHHAK